MKTSLENVSDLERKLNIVVPAQEVQAAFTKAYRGVQKQAVLKGFRKGKAPLDKIRQLYHERLKSDVVQDIVQSYYSTALNELSLEPISYPSIEFDDISEAADFSFTAEFEIRPEVSVTNWEKLPVKREKVHVPEEAVEKAIEDIRGSRAETSPVLEERPAQLGDIAVIAFKGSTLEGPFPNGSSESHELELGSNTFIPGFEDGVMGMSPGQTKTIHLTFPENYQQGLGGKPAEFEVTLKELKKKTLPNVDDEFVKSLGGPFTTVEEMKAKIRDNLEEREKQRVHEDLRNRVLRVLAQRNPVEVPKSLLTEQKKTLVDDFKNRMARNGLSTEDLARYEDQWASDFEEMAKFMVQTSFLVDVLAREHQLVATAQDIEAQVRAASRQMNVSVSQIKQWYAQEDRRVRLVYQVTEDKVAEFLISHAEIEDVAPEIIAAEEPQSPLNA